MLKTIVVKLVTIRIQKIIDDIAILSNGYDFNKAESIIEQAKVDLKNQEISSSLYKCRLQLDLFSKIGE